MNGALLAPLAFSCTVIACLAVTAAVAPPHRTRARRSPSAAAAAVGGAAGVDGTRRPKPSRPPVSLRVGAAMQRRAGVPADDAVATMVGSLAVIAAPLAVVDLRLGFIAAIAVRIRPVLLARRRRLALEQRVVGELPEVTDLVRLGLASGGSTLVALRAVAARPTGPVTDALAAAIKRVDVGHRMADALEELPAELGEPIRPLVRALVSSERYGVELGPTLDRLAHEAREDRRRRAQARARRVPVQMLLPLVLCILPAFVVLTLVPTLVATFETLDL